MKNFKKCQICNKNKGCKQILDHRFECLYNQYSNHSGQIISFLARGNFTNEIYYMYCKIGNNTTLRKIDKFLKNKWVNCCDHLSKFYNSSNKIIKKNTKLSDINDNIFFYEYDYGTSTQIVITKYKKLNGTNNDDNIDIILENDNMHIPCVICKNDSKYIIYNNKNYEINTYCETHKIKSELMHLICNSPRVGVCGYELIESNDSDDINDSDELIKSTKKI